MIAKRFLKNVLRAAGLEVRRVAPVNEARPAPAIPDGELYQPIYSPWLAPIFAAEFAQIEPHTLVSVDRCHVLASLITQATKLSGEVWECGVYRGGTAMLLANRIAGTGRTLRLFDTFEGMPETDAVSTIALSDGSLIAAFDGLPASASRVL